MENYICINGKKAELTEEQMKALGIEWPKASPFKRAKNNDKYYSIRGDGLVEFHYEVGDYFDDSCFKSANYCTNKSIMEQRALHETLNRLLWRYSMEHDGDSPASETGTKLFYTIGYHFADKFHPNNYLFVCTAGNGFSFNPRFDTEEIANNAIKEIVKPFMKAHPEFKW